MVSSAIPTLAVLDLLYDDEFDEALRQEEIRNQPPGHKKSALEKFFSLSQSEPASQQGYQTVGADRVSGVNFDSVDAFRTATSLNNPDMAAYASEQKIAGVASYCQHFADGLDYVAEHYGMVPAGIFLVKDATPYAYADASNVTITLSTGQITAFPDKGAARDPKIAPFLVNADDAAFITGVEEAAHLFIERTQPRQYQLAKERQDTLLATHTDIDPNQLPLEQMVMPIVRQAATEHGIIAHSPVDTLHKPSVSHMDWAQSILEDRTTPAMESMPIR